MGLILATVNRLLLLLYKPEADKFYSELYNAKEKQLNVLFDILKNNSGTDYGKKYRFAEIKTLKDFRRLVPITSYEDYKTDIDRIANGELNVLTAQKVLMFELTGGSGGATKLIPYTKGLKQEFLRGTKPWIYSLYKKYPEIKFGKSYWSITPPAHQKQYTAGGLPIGFEEDSAYFGRIEQFLMGLILVKVKSTSDMTDFYFKTALALLKERSLSLISVWNPSYLLLIIRFIEENSEKLLSNLPQQLRKPYGESIKTRQYQNIWPKLRVISCWCDGAAEKGAKELIDLFRHVSIEPKGILATEAITSIPHHDDFGSILCYRSHFFEFLDINSGDILEYTELKKGSSYEILFTTSGGFYRYRIKDSVQVCDFDRTSGLPLLRFIGKTDRTCDHHGEKLNELFVKQCLENLNDLNPEYRLLERFRLLSYEDDRYVLFLGNDDKSLDKETVDTLSKQLDSLLCEAYHYKLCRDLGQLKTADAIPIYGDAGQQYLNHYVSLGRKLGDIKPELLSRVSGWKAVFETEAIKSPTN